MSGGTIRFESTKYISKEEHKLLTSRCCPEKGDLLLSKVGTTGVPALIQTETPFSIFVSIALIKFFNEYIHPDFLVLMILSPLVQEQAKNNTRGVGNKNWVLTAISDTFLVIPPYQEQLRIIRKVNSLKSSLDRYDNFEKQLNNLNINLCNRMKQSILQESIQGRLVPQIESEGTAEYLLEEIRAEKMRLVKEGKLKKSAIANESRIFRGEDNKYYEQIGETVQEIEIGHTCPESWRLLRLKDLCSLTDGEKREGSYVCLDAKYLRGKSTGEYLSKGKYVHKGDNIILVDGENSGEVFAVPTDGYMGSTFKQLWISKALDKQYVLLFILFHKENLRNSKKGAAIPHLNKDVFNNLIIGIPPLAEQNRIVSQVKNLTQLLK